MKKMYSSIELLNMVKARYCLPSDYAAAAKMGCTRSFLSRVKLNKSSLGYDFGLVAAELLELEPLKVMASIRMEIAERQSDDKAKELWKGYAS